MFTILRSSACVLVATLMAIIATVACDYDGNQSSYTGRSLDNGNGLCTGGKCAEYNGNGISGAMWFGPRLGRKRRSDEKLETSEENISAIADAINSGPWTLISYQGTGDKRHTTQFTPRLGRELADNYLQKYLGYSMDNSRLARVMDSQDDFDMQHQLPPPPPPPPFAPRLGRHLTFNPSPRLGRQLRFVRKI